MNTRPAGMRVAWRAIARTVIDVRYAGIELVYFNLLWFVCSLPLITLPPATGALYVIVRQLSERRAVTWRDFLHAMRDQLTVSWRWGTVNLVAALLFVVNFWFYAQLPQPFGLLLTALLIGFLLVWLLIQLYTYPLLLRQESPSVRRAMRNALALCVRHPSFTLTYAFNAAIFILMSLVVPAFWMIFTAALLGFAYTQAADVLLAFERAENPFADEADEA